MGEIIVGILGVLIGGLFAFQGGNLMRIMFPFIGFFAGFSAGAAVSAFPSSAASALAAAAFLVVRGLRAAVFLAGAFSAAGAASA